MTISHSITGVVLLIVAGCGRQPAESPGPPAPKADAPVASQPAGATRDKPAGEPPLPDVASSAPAFTMTAQEYRAALTKDKDALVEKYKGKVGQLTGTVEKFSSSGGRPILSLASGEPSGGLTCITADPEPWLKVGVGQVVTLKGYTPIWASLPVFGNAILIDPPPFAGKIYTADEFVGEFAADANAAMKYDNKCVVVRGVVAAIHRSEYETVAVTLKTDGPLTLRCAMGVGSGEMGKGLAVGQTRTFAGTFSSLSNGEVLLYSCVTGVGPPK